MMLSPNSGPLYAEVGSWTPDAKDGEVVQPLPIDRVGLYALIDFACCCEREVPLLLELLLRSQDAMSVPILGIDELNILIRWLRSLPIATAQTHRVSSKLPQGDMHHDVGIYCERERLADWAIEQAQPWLGLE